MKLAVSSRLRRIANGRSLYGSRNPFAVFDADVNRLYRMPPTISGFAPTTASQTQSVVITGTNFVGATQVKFGGTNASSFVINSNTQITAVVGTGASGSVSVVTPNGTAILAGFTFV